MSILFFVKYAVLYTGHPLIISVLYLVLSAGLIFFAGNLDHRFLLIRKNHLIFAAVVVSGLVLTYILLVPRMGQIGRYPAIVDWIERFLAGTFPYNSPHTPSSYPVIFLLAFPFYLIGNIGVLEFIGAALFFWYVLRSGDTPRGMSVKILMLLSCVTFYYEIVTRSELFFNMMLAAGVVFYSEKYLKSDKTDVQFFVTAVLTGLVLTTRSVTAFLFVIYFLYKFRFDLAKLILFGILSLAVFSVFIIPLYIWDPVSFMKNGPFAIQSYLSNLPSIFMVLLFLSAFYAGWAIADVQEFFFSGGVILFIAAVFSFLVRVSEIGFSESLYNDGYDIAYFIFCVPLLLLSVKDYTTDRYLGKVYIPE